MKRIYFIVLIAVAVISTSAHSQTLISSEFLSTTSAATNNYLSDVPQHYDVANYKIIYSSTDAHGDSTIASGLLSIPVGTECTELPMMVYCHGTVLFRFDVPSSLNYEGDDVRQFASSGFIALGPDYIGMGESPGRHPYEHGQSEATATIDMIYAAREFLESQDISDSHEVFITGYSQGGHAAMAALMYAQENDLIDSLGIVAGAPCSGTYDLSGTTAPPIISGQAYGPFAFVVYLFESYQMVYGNIYDDIVGFYKSPFHYWIPQYFDGEQTQYDMGYVNNNLPNSLSALLVDTVVSNLQSNPNHPLWLALADNNNYDWAPEMPLRMYYCTGDEIVYYVNSIVAETTMQENGAEDVAAINILPGGNHSQCVEPALNAVWAFFSGLTTLCVPSSVSNVEETPLEMFPNPANGVLNVIIPESNGILKMYDVHGKMVLTMKVRSTQTTVDISALSSGYYVVKLNTSEGVYAGNVVVEK